jgi:hypothetical protein
MSSVEQIHKEVELWASGLCVWKAFLLCLFSRMSTQGLPTAEAAEILASTQAAMYL